MSRSKRLFDLFWTLVGLALLWPLLAAVAVLVKAHDGGPVFFRQWRVGLRGRAFRLWKFRTMMPDSAGGGMMLTVAGDTRVTRVGRWLRQFKLDELPQLFNVLSGDMSLVGPRPEVPSYVALYTARQREVLNFVPGLTDAASIQYRNESEMLGGAVDPERAYVDRIMPAKIRLSLAYAAQATTWKDFLVICTTLRRVFRMPVGWGTTRRSRCFLGFMAAMLATPFAAASGQQMPTVASNPALGPGDALRIMVWRHPELSGDFVVDPDGALMHPLYQTVKVGGVPLAVAKGRLRELLVMYDQAVQLSVEPLWPVTVTGEVRLPNLYRLPQGTTIAQAVALAGGATERGDLRHVRVIQRQGRMTVNLMKNDPRTRDVAIASGDQVLVQARSHFNLLNNLVVPLTTVTTAITSLIILARL